MIDIYTHWLTTAAPSKIIITGEHGVVHGTPGLAIPIKPVNRVYLSEKEGEPTVKFKSKLGEAQLDHNLNPLTEAGPFKPFIALLHHFHDNHGFAPKGTMEIKIESEVPKGVGASASISSALAIILFKYLGKKPKTGSSPEEDELWNAVQVADEVAHGGRPSGIDAMTILRGPTKLTRSVENGKSKWNFKHTQVKLPKNTTLIVVDTFKGQRATTGEMIKRVAKSLGIIKEDGSVKPLNEFTPEDHAKLSLFRQVFEDVEKQLHEKGNAAILGAALSMNHSILTAHGASSKEIQRAVNSLREHPAVYGAKLTGAGGEGGAVIALVKKREAKKVIDKLKKSGFNAFEAKPARGAAE